MVKSGVVKALGAMSGTSLDGVDAALILTDGIVISGFEESTYRAYTQAEREVIRAAFGKWQDDDTEAAAEIVETVHAQVLSEIKGADVIGFHGQTVAHDPQDRGTHQIGSGDILADVLGVPVVWDFRTSDVKMGGQGAPLAPFFHFACAKWIAADAPVAFLNLGGVGNLTYVDPSFDAPEHEGALLAFDTGPANAPINDEILGRTGSAFDLDGALAAMGTVAQPVIDNFLKHPYFHVMPPKSLDRDAFTGLADAVRDLSDADAVATLTACAAASVARGIEHCPTLPARVLVSGGGRRNPTLMAMLADMIPCEVVPVEDVGLDGDMLEAQAFGFLAVRVARGLPTSAQGTTGVRAAVGGGTLSRPDAG